MLQLVGLMLQFSSGTHASVRGTHASVSGTHASVQ